MVVLSSESVGGMQECRGRDAVDAADERWLLPRRGHRAESAEVEDRVRPHGVDDLMEPRRVTEVALYEARIRKRVPQRLGVTVVTAVDAVHDPSVGDEL